MHFTYCPDCGTKAVLRRMGDDGEVPYCGICKKALFDMFSTCVLSVVRNPAGEIALIRQSYGQQDTFVGVAGYMKPGETAEQAALREITEEIGVTAEHLEFLFSAWYEKRGQLMLCFCAETQQTTFTRSEEVAEARWFSSPEAEKAVRPGSIIERVVRTAVSVKKT